MSTAVQIPGEPGPKQARWSRLRANLDYREEVVQVSRTVTSIWQSNPAAFGPRKNRRPCEYAAYLPDRLDRLPLTLPVETAADVSDAERELTRFGMLARQSPDVESLARFLLRAEALASSKIEGLQVNSRRLAHHEAKIAAGIRNYDVTAEAVLGNVTAMRMTVDRVATADMLQYDDVLDIHRELMLHSGRPEMGGVVRRTQNWIGGSDFNPCGAAFVPPPPQHVAPLLRDLCDFVNRDDVPPLVQAAVAHAQFETIHPFADGNGRTGRALIHVVLKRRGLANGFVPPISLVLATRVDAYVLGLTAFRYAGPPTGASAREGVRTWIETFTAATRRATYDAEALSMRLREMEQRWREHVRPRRNSAADRLLGRLPASPVVTVEQVRLLLPASRAASFAAVNQLVAAGVLSQVGQATRDRLFEARDVFQVLTDYERALATESGDTRTEKPGRRVPGRVKGRM